MAKMGQVILIEDDADDEEIFREVLKDLQITNDIICFRNTKDALRHMMASTEPPFIIFSDINLPGQSGLDFKRKIDADPELRKKSIPFIVYSTSVNQAEVVEAYTQMTIQGFFQKAATIDEMKADIKLIFDYWQKCRHPNCL
ncbi:MAG: response regulator [Chitinophagaceae bacterium]|nr:MAG: response regulator [Chitinophagaceae bacterium]